MKVFKCKCNHNNDDNVYQGQAAEFSLFLKPFCRERHGSSVLCYTTVAIRILHFHQWHPGGRELRQRSEFGRTDELWAASINNTSSFTPHRQ